jgi:hypothetical protein
VNAMAQAEAPAVERSCGAAGRGSGIVFDRSSSGISPFQGLRLAPAIQELQSGGDGLIGMGREALGVDTFDISGSGGADTRASAGKYISDNVLRSSRALPPAAPRPRSRSS